MTTKLGLTDEEREALLREEPTTIDELLVSLDVDNSMINPAHIVGYAPTISFDERRIKAPNYRGMFRRALWQRALSELLRQCRDTDDGASGRVLSLDKRRSGDRPGARSDNPTVIEP